MTRREYAERICLSVRQVGKLVEDGTIQIYKGRNKKLKGKINPLETDIRLEQFRNPDADHKRKRKIPKPEGVEDPGEIEPPEAVKLFEQPGEVDASKVPFVESRAVREYYVALKAKLEYEEKIGSLVQAQQVEWEAFRCYRNVRDALQNIPNRVAGLLAAALHVEGQAAQDRVFKILTQEIADALEGASRNAPSQS